MTSFDRRRLLGSLGLGAGTLFLPSMLGQKAQAAEPPKRLVVFYTSHGTVPDRWCMRPPGAGPTTSDWQLPLGNLARADFSEPLRPLHDHRNRLLLLEGLSYASWFADGSRVGHHLAVAHALCANLMRPGVEAASGGQGSSVDQVVADAIARPDRLRHLHLKLQYATALGPRWSPYFRDSVQIGGETSPAKVFSQLFPNGPGTAAMADPLTTPRNDVLDLMKAQFQLQAQRLSGEDRRKLELHQNLVFELRQRVVGLQTATCDVAGRVPADAPKIGEVPYKDRMAIMARLVAAALACDTTRIVGIETSQVRPNDIGWTGGDYHTTVPHLAPNPGPAQDALVRTTVYYAEMFKMLLDALAAVPEGSGTLLDNTAVLWLSELGVGWHGTMVEAMEAPLVLAGGAGGAFKTGRYLSYARTVPAPNGVRREVGPGHSRLLVSIMQAMGVARNSIGLTEAKGIPLTGPLPYLAG